MWLPEGRAAITINTVRVSDSLSLAKSGDPLCSNEWPHIQSGMTWHEFNRRGVWVRSASGLGPVYFWVRVQNL